MSNSYYKLRKFTISLAKRCIIYNNLPLYTVVLFQTKSKIAKSARAGPILFFFPGEERVDCVSKGFRVTDPRGGVLFSADREQVIVGAEMLRVTGDGGAVFQGSVQTPLVRGESGRGLR